MHFAYDMHTPSVSVSFIVHASGRRRGGDVFGPGAGVDAGGEGRGRGFGWVYVCIAGSGCVGGGRVGTIGGVGGRIGRFGVDFGDVSVGEYGVERPVE